MPTPQTENCYLFIKDIPSVQTLCSNIKDVLSVSGQIATWKWIDAVKLPSKKLFPETTLKMTVLPVYHLYQSPHCLYLHRSCFTFPFVFYSSLLPCSSLSYMLSGAINQLFPVIIDLKGNHLKQPER